MPKQKWQWAVFLKADCAKELSPKICVLVKEGGTSNSLLAPSHSAGLSLSNWNVVVFAFQTQYIQRLFVRNNIDTSLLICTLYSIFGRESYVSLVILVLSALISMNWIVHFSINLQKKSFCGICRMRNRLRVTILWCNIICTIKWGIVLSGSACGHVCNWVTKYTRVFGFTIDLVLSVVDRACI